MTVLLFIAVLFTLILVHEFGHFITAKWSKMYVEEFAIGFPPRIFSWVKGETRYALNILPIGGYVKILGENGEGEIPGVDKARSFASRPRRYQALVLIAGVAMNIITAWVIFYAVAIIGTPTLVEESATAPLTVLAVIPNSPADQANIPLGAEIIFVSSHPDILEGKLTSSNFSDFIINHPDVATEIVYLYKNEETTTSLEPATGLIEGNPERAVIGLSTGLVEVVQENPISALWTATTRTSKALIDITVGLFGLFASIFTLSADLSQVTGPIGIAGMVGDAAEFGLVPLLIFTAFISLNLAVINLLPIPALDGGRLIFVAIEAVTRRTIDPIWMGRVNLVGFAFLILLMIAVTFQDVIKLI